MGNSSSQGYKNNFRKATKLKKQKIDKKSKWRGISLCKNEYMDDGQEAWLLHFKGECNDLKETCQWANQCLYALKSYEGYPVSHYQTEISSCGLSRNSIQGDGKSKKKKKSYEHLNPQQKYKKLYKKSDLIEEDQNSSFSLTGSLVGGIGPSIGGNKKSSSINSFSINNNQNKNSFSSINSSPSYVFPQYLIHRNEIQNQNREQIEALELYVLKTSMIAKHLQDNNNVLGFLTQIFLETYINSYEGISKRLYEMRKQKLNTPINEEAQIVDKAIQDIQQFIRVMQETIQLFYNLNREFKRSNTEIKKNPVPNHFNRENMLNFVTSQVFANQKLYEITFMLLQLEDLDQEARLQQSMITLIDKNPQDFYIQDRLCLNERTLKHFNKGSVKYIQEEQENEFTGTESLNAVTEKDSNYESEIKNYKRKNDKYLVNENLVEEKVEEENQEDMSIRKSPLKKDTKYEDEEETKFNEEDCSELACQIGGIKQFGNSHKKNTKQQNNHSQEVTKSNLSNHPTNQSSHTPSHMQQRKSHCKELEYYYTQSFDNKIELFKDANLNNSQTFHHPLSSDQIQNQRESYASNNEEITEKESEEGQQSSSSSSALENSKENQVNNSKDGLQAIQKNFQSDIHDESNQQKNDELPDKFYFEKLKRESYYKCFKYILKIKKQQSPIGKMKMIVKASENILVCINNFYKMYGIQQNNFLDADDVLSIFSYFTCKCFQHEMNTHIKLISKFITSNLLNSISGYYLTTLSASLQNILEFRNGSLLQSVIEQ
ncbi:vacuolar sorting protein 9, VPS9 domain protein (macronuclear) [Tetrahymena thermophila SB210]|uniref:Vacuolar sorting protein 9, VPS9 domain protein n=1 Tax=Tetrahymena thermophila (strain SB210) TaxID=312017 RepID=Q24BB5_TETTS|nr:vacuolar sorting protein 9, VPS9 domain protein [Tetrahymena thermophila SB210]EAS05056.1 vacuolar sorting protein 9, VPS9 domain protein [Tetrahymena thermophila SB210]|eukprot:XP_001025301.1 vacuolar sorting protein 9, VPS9 domain protein [Tetrahymena thermophila SB210]